MQAWDKAAETFDLYINGAKQPTTGATLGTWAGLPAADSMYLGAGQANGNNFPGRMGHNVLLNVAPTYAQSQLIAKSRGVICFEGDSRTAAKSWPFAAAEAGTQDGGLFAFGGRGVSCMATSGANHLIIDARKATIDAHIQPGKSNILVFWAGVNCGALGGGIYEWARDYLLARRAAGWTKIVWCSEIDGNPANWHAANWPAFNAEWAADTTTADVKVDLGAIPQLQDYTNATYFVDGIHLTAAGYALVQTAVTAGIAAAV
jgi:hypothetical protein